jgi:hypothetical protein
MLLRLRGGRADAAQPETSRRRTASLRDKRPTALADLRIGRETDDQLVEAPMPNNQRLTQVPFPVDDKTAQLSGRAYLEYLAQDVRLSAGTRFLIEGPKILRDQYMTEQKFQTLAERLRPVMAQCHSDPALAAMVDDMAMEATSFCGDRTEYFIGRMQDMALLSTLSKGETDDLTLYNCGISFFKLDAVRAAVGERCNVGSQEQNVHNYLDAEYYLQDELGLPTHHATPGGPDQSHINRQIAAEIGKIVKALLAANDGDNVMQFMSTWGPWQEHLQKAHPDKFERLNNDYHAILEKAIEDRENPDNPRSKGSHKEFVDYVNSIQRKREEWTGEVVGAMAREFLLNHRGGLRLDMGQMPECFRQ